MGPRPRLHTLGHECVGPHKLLGAQYNFDQLTTQLVALGIGCRRRVGRSPNNRRKGGRLRHTALHRT